MPEWRIIMRKNKVILSLVLVLVLVLLAGCSKDGFDNDTNHDLDQDVNQDEGNGKDEVKKLVIGASASPHAEILEQIKDELKAEGYQLEIIEYVDYVQPNLALDKGDIDANFFQHKPYLDQFNEENSTEISSAAIIHYEPFGIYPGKTATIEELKDGAEIAVPNDTTNEARALLLLEAQGLITVRKGAGLNATIKDIVDNPKNLKIIEIEAAQLPRSLPDVDLAVINGNYAIEAGLKVGEDAIAVEGKDSEAADTFGNIIAIKTGDENREDIKALIKALQSDTVKDFINTKYEGAVVPQF